MDMFVGGLDIALLREFRERFASDAKNQLAQNVCVKHDLLDVLRVSQIELTPHVYNHKVLCRSVPLANRQFFHWCKLLNSALSSRCVTSQ